MATFGVEAAVVSSDTATPSTFAGSVGIGVTNPVVSLDVAGWVRAGGNGVVTTCGAGAANAEGSQRYNYASHVMEYCNGSTWIPLQVPTSPGVATAWVNFAWSGSAVVIRGAYNVPSVTRSSAGTYVVNFATPMADANYAVAFSCSLTTTVVNFAHWYNSLTTSSVTVFTYENNA